MAQLDAMDVRLLLAPLTADEIIDAILFVAYASVNHEWRKTVRQNATHLVLLRHCQSSYIPYIPQGKGQKCKKVKLFDQIRTWLILILYYSYRSFHIYSYESLKPGISTMYKPGSISTM